MPVLKSKLKRRRTIELSIKKSIVLLANETHVVDQKDVESPIIKELIEKGELVIIGEERKGKKEPSLVKEKDR